MKCKLDCFIPLLDEFNIHLLKFGEANKIVQMNLEKNNVCKTLIL